MDFTPVPRRYVWTEFRSSLEADWACTLDGLHIKWEYEPSTFVLPTGTVYCPDFWLPEIGTFIEVKGETVPRQHKPRELAEALQQGTPWDEAGGIIVLLGLAPVRIRDEYGHPALGITWREALPGALRLVHCPSCTAWSWTRISQVIACRKCRQRFTFCHLAGPGEITFRLSDHSEWTVVR